jgi:hypothetical protein
MTDDASRGEDVGVGGAANRRKKIRDRKNQQRATPHFTPTISAVEQ